MELVLVTLRSRLNNCSTNKQAAYPDQQGVVKKKRLGTVDHGCYRILRKFAGQPQDLEEQIYQSLIRNGDTVFDIGANIGSVALIFSRLAGPNGKVIAFEPLWPAYEKLCSAIRKCSGRDAPIMPVPVGVSDFAGDREINVPDDWYGYGSLAPAEQWKATHPHAKIKSYECSFVTLDAFMKSKRLSHPDFMVEVEAFAALPANAPAQD